MATDLTNGHVPSLSISSKEEAKAIHKQLNNYYRKGNPPKRKPESVLNGLGEVETSSLNIKIQKTQTEWSVLKTGSPFVCDLAGVLLYVKIGSNRAMCLNTMQSTAVAGGMMHRVFF